MGAGRPVCREERTLISDCIYKRLKKNSKVHPRTGHESPEGGRHIALLLL